MLSVQMDPFGVFIEVYNRLTSPKPPYKVGKHNLENSRALMTLSGSFWRRLGSSGTHASACVWRRAPSCVLASLLGRSRFFWKLREVPGCFSMRSVFASRMRASAARAFD